MDVQVQLLPNKMITIHEGSCDHASKKRNRQANKKDETNVNNDEEVTRNRSPKQKKFLGSTCSLDPTPELTTYGGIKLGWIQGVLIPCLLNIWGVMLFLRISWVVGQAGTGVSMAIILVSGVVCVITTLSLSAICTNGHLKGGGVYYLVSRSLGVELGASVGIIFAFANAVAASMNTIGFCDSLNQLLKAYHLKILDNGVNDTRIVGTVALLVMCLICAIGMDWETKAQNFLIIIIVLAIVNFILGVSLGPRDDTAIAQGFVGVSLETMKQNLNPDFRYDEGQHHDVFSVFAIYFPAVTGVQAGANICGDLKDPATAIPKGTLLALLISMLSYIMIALLCGAGALRDASGNTANLKPAALAACAPSCSYGLHHDYEIMKLMSTWGPLLYGGCWAATLSTALTNLLSVPRLIQALGVDRIYPGLIFFSKPYGKHGEPYRGYVLTFFVSLAFLLIANLNTIAPLITNFYLASYALINFCTFHAAFIRHISWRPTFHYYNMWVSLLGAALCCAIMVMLSWIMALVTVFAFLLLYLIVVYRKPEADWGSSTEAQRYVAVVQTLVAMNQKHSVKSYNPQVLVMSGPAGRRPALVQLASLLTHGSYSLLADIYPKRLTSLERETRIASAYQWLLYLHKTAFFTLLDGTDFEAGVRALLQASGLGGLAPNIMLLGYKFNWAEAKDTDVYVRVIQLAFEQKLGVTIFRTPSEYRTEEVVPLVRKSSSALLHRKEIDTLMYKDSEISTKTEPVPPSKSDDNLKQMHTLKHRTSSVTFNIQESQNDKPLPASAVPKPVFKLFALETGTIDAWWLYDDGGLSILLPYILSHRGATPERLRIFARPRSSYDKNHAETSLRSILAQFRIAYASLQILSGVDDAPKPASWDLFHSIITTATPSSSGRGHSVNAADQTRWNAKTTRKLRLRELLIEHSSKAALVVMALPMPRKELPAVLYMAWLDILSRDLPPMLFVRGSQQVLTYEA